MTLTEFLLARIAEDEAPWEGVPHDARLLVRAEEQYEGVWMTVPKAAIFLSRKKALAECEAKRQVVTYCRPMIAWGDQNLRESKTGTALLRMLALPYANHPDYDEAWSA